MPEFWIEKSAILKPTRVVTTPTLLTKAGVSTGFFNVSTLIYPQGKYLFLALINGEHIHGSPFTIVRNPRPPPKIVKVKFFDSLVRLQVVFDAATNRARMKKGDPCDVIFTKAFTATLGQGHSCAWKNSKELSISLGYKATVTSDGDSATLNSFVLDGPEWAGGVATELENSFPTNGSSPVLISNNPPNPVAVIVAPVQARPAQHPFFRASLGALPALNPAGQPRVTL